VSIAIILDAAALDGEPYSAATRGLIERTLERDGELWCSAVNLAEVCRGRARTSEVESFLSRGIRIGLKKISLNVRSTDEAFAKRVGTLLCASSRGSENLADAHVVALCADFETAIVLTTDPEDILSLAESIPAVRVLVRKP
jgi:predicted nucleic acid-binding protein